jgi:hypothetical protein
MSMDDTTIQPTFSSDVRQATAKKLRESSARPAVPESEPRRQKEPERPDTATEVLQRVAERALERPPRDIQKLTASAAKFLLINLEPALRLAEELRQDSLSQSAQSLIEMLLDGRQDRAVTLLTDPSR